MKKWILVLGMITCVLGLTGCGAESKKEEAVDPIILESVDSTIELINGVVSQGLQIQYGADPMAVSAFESWEAALEDMGSYQEIVGHQVSVANGVTTIRAEVKGTKRNAEVEFVLEENEFTGEPMITSITTNVKYTLGELMVKAALNTVLGMGTVFLVLILISVIIACFTFIPKIQAAFSKKEKTEEIRKEAVDNAVAQIVEKEEILSDDLELIAVIAAAVAASEGAESADGYVVRSIRRVNGNKWRHA